MANWRRPSVFALIQGTLHRLRRAVGTCESMRHQCVAEFGKVMSISMVCTKASYPEPLLSGQMSSKDPPSFICVIPAHRQILSLLACRNGRWDGSAPLVVIILQGTVRRLHRAARTCGSMLYQNAAGLNKPKPYILELLEGRGPRFAPSRQTDSGISPRMSQIQPTLAFQLRGRKLRCYHHMLPLKELPDILGLKDVSREPFRFQAVSLTEFSGLASIVVLQLVL